MMTDEIAASNGTNFTENNFSQRESTGNVGEDEENWLYERPRTDENNPTGTIDDGNEQEEIEPQTNPTMSSASNIDQLDDDSDDDDDNIQVTIGDIRTAPPMFPGRQLSRQSNPAQPAMPMKSQPHRGVDLEAQGMINGQPTYEHDINNAYKDEEKPWKKPGADISDYFNYGFTEETWAAYCDRQRRLRSENNTARLNAAQVMPPMPPMIPGHLPMMHPLNPMPVVAMHKPPMNVSMIPPRPYMNQRKPPDGKIDVIGGTDSTSRRQMYEMQNNFDHPPFINGPQFSAGQPPNSQTVGDLVSTPPTSNGPPTPHGTPTGANHAIPTLGGHRMPMIPPPGMQFRHPYGHPHVPGGPGFFPHGPGGPMHGERPPGPYFVQQHPQQPWEKPGVPPVHGFPPGHFPPPNVATTANPNNGRPAASSRSPTPEDQSSRSSTPEENRPNSSTTGAENDKTSKDDRYKDRYRDERDRHTSSHRRSPGKDRSSSSYRSSRHRSGDHEYERPRGDRKSSRDRDDKYERYSRKRHHRDDSSRHHRGGGGPDDDSSRSHRARRTPPRNFSSPPKSNSQSTSNDPTQNSVDNVEGQENNGSSSTPTITGATSGSPSGSRSRREDSSSRHSHHKKSSKRSRRDDSGDERSHHRRRSKDKSSSSKKTSSSSSNINALDSTADGKEQQQQQQQLLND